MFGEFETDDSMSVDEKASLESNYRITNTDEQRKVIPSEHLGTSLRERIGYHLAKTDAVLKSQQRNEPDLSFDERLKLSLEILEEKPGQFLYRFGKYLVRDHLQYFYAYIDDPEVDYYLKELQKSLNTHTSRIQMRNRRYGALQRLKKSGSYFSETEMKNREPLLYEELIGRNLTDEEKLEQTLSSIPPDSSFSELLLHHLDKEEEEERKGMLKESEEDKFQEEEEEDDDASGDREDDVDMDDQAATGRDKVLLREEFYSSMYSGFVTGYDKEFDYSRIDTSEEFDLLDVRNRDEEERYFDADEPEEEITLSSLTLSAGPKDAIVKEGT